MTAYVAMLRAVNVGGATVSMAALREIGADAGFGDVSTHLNSGNLLFTASSGSAADHAATISGALAGLVGRPVPVIVRTPVQLQRALDAAGARFGEADQKFVAIAFLSGPAHGGPEALGDWADEEYLIDGDALYLHYPAGQARSKLTLGVIEKRLGVVATARGVRTVSGLIARSTG